MTTRQTWQVRALAEAECDAFVNVDAHAFGVTAPDELDLVQREEYARSRNIGTYDGDELVGIATAYAYRLSVPGATLPTAAVSWVGVLPTHRRRGVLSALMSHQLRAVHEAGDEPLAILWASEPQIYGRFGYGLATRKFSVSVPRDPHSLVAGAPVDPDLRLRLVDAADWKLTAGVYEEVARARPGMPERDEAMWVDAARDIAAMRQGKSALRCVVAEDGNGVRGYARYATKQSFNDAFGAGTVSVREVLAADPPALAALYRYLFDLDLMGTTSLWNVPVDGPLLHWLANPRKAQPALGDALYVRLVDVGGALARRTYSEDIDVVLDVSDSTCPWNAGRWRLTGGREGASCERTEDEADLSLGVVDLGAAYLGGTDLVELAGCGRVTELRPGSLRRAAMAFHHTPAPWSPSVF